MSALHVMAHVTLWKGQCNVGRSSRPVVQRCAVRDAVRAWTITLVK
jgi:hypothetical protein